MLLLISSTCHSRSVLVVVLAYRQQGCQGKHCQHHLRHCRMLHPAQGKTSPQLLLYVGCARGAQNDTDDKLVTSRALTNTELG